MNATEITECTRCGECCRTNPCLPAQYTFGYPVLLGVKCPAFTTLSDGTTSCKWIEENPEMAELMVGTGCEKPFPEEPMDFQKVLIESMMNTNLVKEYNRLRGSSLNFIPQRRGGITALIDEATGYDDLAKLHHQNKPHELHDFIQFVFECIWLPLIMEANK